MGMTPPFSHIPNLDAGVLESAVREQEIDGESLLLLTQVSRCHIPPVSADSPKSVPFSLPGYKFLVWSGYGSYPKVKK